MLTDEGIGYVRRLLERYQGLDDESLMTTMLIANNLVVEIPKLLAEIERLRAQLGQLAYEGTGYSQQTMDALVRERDGLLAEIERLRAERPSCATCKFSAPSRFDGMLFCGASDSHVEPEYTDGKCLWEAK